MFQFLLGTLKTPTDGPGPSYQKVVSIPLRYAKNTVDEKIMVALKEFQFLLGTLKTIAIPGLWVDIDVVSIPLRYAKNSLVKTYEKVGVNSFNSS